MRHSLFAILSITLWLLVPAGPAAAQENGSGDGFSLSADVNTASGDQGVTTLKVSPEAQVSVQVFAGNARWADHVSIRILYDSGQVTFESGTPGGLISHPYVLMETTPNSVTWAMTSMRRPAGASSGLAATFHFRATAAFTGTTIRIVEATLSRGGDEETVTPGVDVVLRSVGSGPSPDFDGDGTVGLPDLTLFIQTYRSVEGDGTYEARFDLDEDGAIAFSDFLILSDRFGQAVQPPPPPEDRDALVALYHATGGYNWRNQTNWLTDQPIDTWHGVTAANGRVTGLKLRANNLAGELPAELGNLARIDTLDLSVNRRLRSGPIPSWLGNLDNLRYLSFYATQLSDPIPSWLGNLDNLTHLDLAFNRQMGGPIPPELGNLVNLEYLDLFGCRLSGPIPSELGNLDNLRYLSLYWNELTGPIPSWLGDMTNLIRLDLGLNRFSSGPIPSWLSNLAKLEFLRLTGQPWHGSQLTGPIPSELGNLANLKLLHLQGNALTGEIPVELNNLTNLVSINLTSNQLSGPVPSELGNADSLRTLYLSNNQFSGTIPSALGDMTNLWGLGTLSNLGVLNLEGNELSGPLPSELGNLSELAWLHLEGNQLSLKSSEFFQI